MRLLDTDIAASPLAWQLIEKKMTTQVLADVMRQHPLQNITPSEIRQAAEIVKRSTNISTSLGSIRFKYITLYEPPKALLMPYLDAENDGIPVESRPFVPRLAAVLYADESGQQAFESIVSLDTDIEIDVAKLVAGQRAPCDG